MPSRILRWTGLPLLAVIASLALLSNALATTTADHGKFKELQQPFDSGPAVTKACLSCHTEASKQLHKTKHWTWEYLNPEQKQMLGKKHVVNNFCISAPANYAYCTSCHIGYGWKDDSFDFTSEVNVDCLACHDTTGKYKKPAGMAGNPATKEMEFPPGSGKIVKPVDLAKVAQKVGKTSRDTCGSCHFHGGGGDAVKHGDLDSSLEAPEKSLDVHMDATGLNFTCATCHMGRDHDVVGSRYAPTAKTKGGKLMRGLEEGKNPASCQSCHGDRPHAKADDKLNDHARKVACQTCHVPEFARGGIATKMTWDWSTAGKMGADGKPMVKKDAKGKVIYDTRKGDFSLAENVVPEYTWFNGQIKYTLVGDKVDKSTGVTPINRFLGGPDDGKSMIWPVKVFRGAQPYDPVTHSLVTPHTAGQDDTAYWKNFDWGKAIASGMASVNAPFSGKIDFLKTEMSWPITHMVAPKEKALDCQDCHRDGGRLAAIKGVYLPGRDRNELLDAAGFGLAGMTLIGMLAHGGLRIVTRRKGEKK